MAGNNSIRGDETVTFTDNMSFDGTERGGKMTTDGQIWIGSSVLPHVRLGSLSAGAGISITNGNGTITITNTGGGGGGSLTTLAAASGAAVESGGVITVLGTTGITTVGGGSTLTISPANDLAALETLSGTGFAARTGVETWALRTYQAGSGISITNPAGIVGDPTFSASAIVATSYTADSGSAAPSSNNLNLLGSGSITTSGAASTITTQLTGLTNHNVLIGAGTTTITKVAPSATTGIALVSQGASADPAFSTVVVAGGGTGQTSLTNHSVLVGATTTAITQLTVGTNGQVLVGATAADPAFATLTSSDSSITFTTGVNTLSLQVASGTTVGKTITGDSGGALSPTSGNWNLFGLSGSKTSGSGSTLTIKSPPFSQVSSTATSSLNTGEFVTAAVTRTLPASAGLADGDLFIYVCTTAGILIIQFVTAQKIRIGNIITSAAGTATSTAIGDSLSLRFNATDGFFYAVSVIGNWTLSP